MMKKLLKTLPVVLVLFGVLSLATGITFALLSSSEESEKIQIIKSGVIELTLTESGSFDLLDVNQMTDTLGFEQEKYHQFTIENTGDADSKYRILLLDDADTIVTFDGTVLNDKYVRVGLEVDGEKMLVQNLNEVSRVIYESNISKGEKKTFKLRLWLNFTNLTDDEISSLEGAKIFLKMKIVAEQIFTDAL